MSSSKLSTFIKRQSTEWEKIFGNHISDKGLISKIYTGLLKINKKTKTPNSKMGKGLSHFSKKDIKWPIST